MCVAHLFLGALFFFSVICNKKATAKGRGEEKRKKKREESPGTCNDLPTRYKAETGDSEAGIKYELMECCWGTSLGVV